MNSEIKMRCVSSLLTLVRNMHSEIQQCAFVDKCVKYCFETMNIHNFNLSLFKGCL